MAAVSPWLNSGLPAPDGAALLLKIYAHRIHDQADAANRCIIDSPRH